MTAEAPHHQRFSRGCDRYGNLSKPKDDSELNGSAAGGLEAQGISPAGEVHWNLTAPVLIQAAIRRDEGQLADMGPFCAVTSPHTGRSPNDKFVVKEAASAGDVDWGKVNQPITDDTLRDAARRRAART